MLGHDVDDRAFRFQGSLERQELSATDTGAGQHGKLTSLDALGGLVHAERRRSARLALTSGSLLRSRELDKRGLRCGGHGFRKVEAELN